mmetsp:Transcript_34052/g.79766  ORF Transcript_34052/g.79766 Transcript_34052/m.79766 type:complete len:182 (-) Transcript_34052:22-567(-)
MESPPKAFSAAQRRRGGVPTVLATVGTTKFEALVDALDTERVQKALRARGYGKLLVQRGKSSRTPCQRTQGLTVEVYQYKASMAEDMASSDLIISHAGAGSVMEALRAGKALIVVANEVLMDNHQVELANAMQQKGYLSQATPSNLDSVIQSTDWSTKVPLPPLDFSPLRGEIEGMLGARA